MLSICLFFTECKPRYASKEKHVFTDIEILKLEKYYVLLSAISLLMAYKQIFNKHVLETIQICDVFLYLHL